MSYPDVHYSGDEGEISARFRPMIQEPDLLIGARVAVRYLASKSRALYQKLLSPNP